MKEFKIEKVFEQDYFNEIQNYFKNHFFLKNAEYDFYNSKRIDSFDDQVLQEI